MSAGCSTGWIRIQAIPDYRGQSGPRFPRWTVRAPFSHSILILIEKVLPRC
jgi:hypothetical protein